MININQAIYKLYPQVISISGDVAYDVNNQIVQYDLQNVITQAQKDDCKAQAKTLLSASDWSALPDVQITNKADFDNYRAILRGYVISPVVNPTFPTEPSPIWV